MQSNTKLWGLLIVAASLTAGCADSNEPAAQSETAAKPDATYLMADAPENAQGVGAVRESAEGDEEVTVVGHIGGSAEPFVEGMAAFTIVDPKLEWCAEEEGCPTPWDYCCAPGREDNTALVKVVGQEGQLVSKDARELLGVKELSKVIVRGKAQRDDAGNLTVLAEKVHVVQE